MYNWSVDEKQMKKADPKGYELWRLEQMINYGQPAEKLSKRLIKKHWARIKQRINPGYRQYLEMLLWPQKSKAS